MIFDHIEKWEQYRDARRGTYEFRARTRYKAVADRLFALGLDDKHSVMDVGAGSCQLGRYLRARGWRGLYIPVDAVLDGVDLETWEPHRGVADFVVSLEVVEHITIPHRLIGGMVRAAREAVVLTTPNCEAVDVLTCDPTHVSVIRATELEPDFTVERHSWFGVPNDTLMGWAVAR